GLQCCLQILEKGRYLSKTGFRVSERCLIEMSDDVKLKKLVKMIKKLQIAVPVSRGHAMDINCNVASSLIFGFINRRFWFSGQDLQTGLQAKENGTEPLVEGLNSLLMILRRVKPSFFEEEKISAQLQVVAQDSPMLTE
nr:hypothetical protein [Tanacetum cinerariifolium]